MRSLILVSVLLLSATLSSAAAENSPPKLGGWEPIKNLADPVVQEIASFAVAENNKKTNNTLKLSHLVSGETQVVSGVKYRLIIEVAAGNGGGDAGTYEAIVWDKPWEKFRELISFQKVNYVGHNPPPKPLVPGGYQPIKNLSDPVVQEIASFAVAEYNKRTNSVLKLKLSHVVSGETQVVAGVNYRLIIEATPVNGGGDAEKYEVIVYVKPGGKSRELTSFHKINSADHNLSAVGAYQPIKNLSDPVVQEIASFAVAEYNKRTNSVLKLKLSHVVSGETQVVAGVNYRLIIEATPVNGGGDARKYEVIVYVKPGGSRELTSFHKINSADHNLSAVGAYQPIKNLSDPVVQEIAKFAVDEYNKRANVLKLKLSYVVSGETQVVAGVNYRLIIEATSVNGGGDAGKYEAIVYVKPRGKSRELTSFHKV